MLWLRDHCKNKAFIVAGLFAAQSAAAAEGKDLHIESKCNGSRTTLMHFQTLQHPLRLAGCPGMWTGHSASAVTCCKKFSITKHYGDSIYSDQPRRSHSWPPAQGSSHLGPPLALLHSVVVLTRGIIDTA